MDKLIVDDLQKLAGDKTKEPFTGKLIYAGPFEMEKTLDFTGLRGSGSNIYYALAFQVPKWNYTVLKVDEYIEVTPTWVDYYNLTIAQKQKLEASIKAGLTSAAQAVSDYELLKHDMRRYKEVLNYFLQAEKTGDDHVLRNLFIDRVDMHTGEGYSLVSMARRWPTIITDFVRMNSDWTDPKKYKSDKDQLLKIKEELDVSQAEATALKTKNQLFREWKELFFPEIKDRVSRLQVLVNSRKKSIEEYRNWLKPYVARYRMIREVSETRPAADLSNPYMTPGFGQSQATTGVRLWIWKNFWPAEMGKAEAFKEKRTGGFIIDPYDDIVRHWQKKIEDHYKVKFTEKEIRQKLADIIESGRRSAGPGSTIPLMNPNTLYYILFDVKLMLNLLKTPPPEGFETDNLMFLPIKAWIASQNVILIHLIEIWAREKAFERYINELIGTSELEEEELKKIEEMFEPKEEKKERPWEKFSNRMGNFKRRAKPHAEKFAYLFVKPGPYEPVFRERLTKYYARGLGGLWGQMIGYIEETMGVE
jgi:hypothetical protein